MPAFSKLDSLEEVADALNDQGYVSDSSLSMSIFLALKMRRPLFLEGAPGVGKTEVARVLSRAFQTELIRLQCYEGLDVHHALYEWNYPRQLLQLQAGQGEGLGEIYSDEYLLKRPLLQAIDPTRDKAAVLLIDEIDRADEEFEIHDALKRRCIYCWIDYPSFDKEMAIVSMKVPRLSEHVQRQVVALVQKLRREDLLKPPGVAETLDWAEALLHLGIGDLETKAIQQTLGVLLKNQEDISLVDGLLEDDAWAAQAG